MRESARQRGRQRRPHLPAVVVGVLLGVVALALIGVSIFVEGPRSQEPSQPGTIVTAVTPTEPGGDAGAAIPAP